ncbi:hypothetical protein [Paenibacillus pectinilyticus]|nr:hypothetical protein [Paenibacillus pectinilyticus]
MLALWRYITQHWLSIALILGALLACWYVYKNKDKYIRGWSNK